MNLKIIKISYKIFLNDIDSLNKSFGNWNLEIRFVHYDNGGYYIFSINISIHLNIHERKREWLLFNDKILDMIDGKRFLKNEFEKIRFEKKGVWIRFHYQK
jgi:hypothetical protein